jgi:hypothetical protein
MLFDALSKRQMSSEGFYMQSHLAASIINRTVFSQCIVAIDAETRKAAKYSSLAANYICVPIATEI